MSIQSETSLTPKLRFPEFGGDWEEKSIGKILTIGSGRDYQHLGNGVIPVYGTGGYMNSVDNYLYDGESVCIGRKGTINKPLFIRGKFWTVDTLFYTHSFNHSIPRFVFYLFKKINWLKYNEASGVPSLSKKTIEKISIFIPRVSEQTKIANFLTSVDSKIEQLSKKQSLLEKYKKGLMQKIFTQELRFKTVDGSNFPDWENRKLGDCSSIEKGSQLNRANLNEIGNYPAINGGINPSGYTDNWNTKENTITISEGGNSCGYVNLITTKFWSGGHCYSVKELEDDVLNIFLYQNLKHNQSSIMKLRVGSGLPNIQKGDITNFKIKIPHLDEQTKIANFLSSIDNKIEQIGYQLDETKQFKKALLQQMFV